MESWLKSLEALAVDMPCWEQRRGITVRDQQIIKDQQLYQRARTSAWPLLHPEINDWPFRHLPPAFVTLKLTLAEYGFKKKLMLGCMITFHRCMRDLSKDAPENSLLYGRWKTVFTVRTKQYVKSYSGEILKYACEGHFTIPWSHRRGFVNGSEATQLTLVGHI